MAIEKGFYMHYKSGSEASGIKKAYEVIGTAFQTEARGAHSNDPKDFEKDEVVVYRPLFADSLVYQAGKRFWVRPIAMFLETVMHEGKAVPRFQKIEDPTVIDALKNKARELYGEK